MLNRELLSKLLLKKAKGFLSRERTDEYVVVNGEKQLVKSKTVTKRVPPDVTAIKALIALDDGSSDVTNMTDEQLEVEKLRLIRLLSFAEGGGEE